MDILKGVVNLSLEDLLKQGKTYIYKESEIESNITGWEFWGKRVTENENVFVYRKIVTKEEAKQYEFGED